MTPSQPAEDAAVRLLREIFTGQPCGDYVSDLRLAGPCIVTAGHPDAVAHDDGHGNTWRRGTTGGAR
ncbi:hypothetical protein [Isoptericola sp. NPDC055881]